MTREEIIRQGIPIEPYCFETDREEQWYNLGLYDGAIANPWHSIANGDLPKDEELYLCSDGSDYIIGEFDKKKEAI